jgi:ABC-2 type transport system permease protein
VLAGANALWLVLTLIGGVLVPTDRLPSVLAAVGRATPTGALSHGLRAALVRGHTDVVDLLVLLAWGLVLGVAAARTFRWE